MNAILKQTITFVAVLCSLLIASCGESFENPPIPNSMTLDLDEILWEGDSTITSAVVSNSDGFVNVLISSVNASNEGFYISITARPEELSGTHLVSSQANGTFIAYSSPGSIPGLESHNSFNCINTNGTIFITEFDTKNKVITGEFTGNVCSQTGELLKITNGLFYQVSY